MIFCIPRNYVLSKKIILGVLCKKKISDELLKTLIIGKIESANMKYFGIC